MTPLDTLHLVDPELRPLLAAFPTTMITADNLAELRTRELPPMPVDAPDVVVEERSVPGPDGAQQVRLRVYRPKARAEAAGCVFHIHGGGYVGGSAREVDFLLRPIAQTLGCVVVSVDYRLAPEAPFPAAIEDCYAGLVWTFAHADELGVDPARIGVMGESAGGGLAAALALLARDRAGPSVAFQHLTYPMLDDRTCVREPNPVAGQFIWHAANNRFGWSSLLGKDPGGENVSSYAAPARATDLSGLPPAYVMTGALDLFVDEDVEYARRLMAAGVPVELHVYPGAFHGFDLLPGTHVSDQARAARLAALVRALA